MKQRLRSAAFVTALLGASVAYAATPAPQSQPPPAAGHVSADAEATQAANQINRTPLAQLLKQQLGHAGLTDIDVKSATFIVHAKTKSGNPVVLAVGPNGVTEIVKVTAPVVAEQSH